MPPKNQIYRWTRDLHLYAGLFISPFLLVYAISVFFIIHAPVDLSDVEIEKSNVTVTVPDDENSRDIARKIVHQLEITGEMGWVSLNQSTNTLTFVVDKPGQHRKIHVDMRTGETEINTQNTGKWDAMVYHHKMPGPHNVSIRGNWIFIMFWGWLADTTAYLLLFVSASGVYLWTVVKAERRTGLIALGAGTFTFILLLFSILR